MTTNDTNTGDKNMNAKINNADFAAAKKAVKKNGVADTSCAHRIAIETLRDRCPRADDTLLADMGWQVVMCAR
jgi:hypothetical protein